jgi:alpha-glucosidase
LLHSQPTYTIEQTRQGPFSLLVSLSADSQAFGTAFVDDGISNPPGSSTTLSITGSKGQLRIQAEGTFNIKQPLQDITILGVKRPTKVIFQDETAKNWIHVEAQDKLVVSKINGDLNSAISLKWE